MSRKTAYLQAIVTAPDLVVSESDPMQFLRYCRYDVLAAAERLVLYWEVRKNAFGLQRAYLPLNQTGDGALTPNDVLQLKAGFPALLPNSRTGLQVLFCDQRQYLQPTESSDQGNDNTSQTGIRCFFYLAHLMAKDSIAQLDGVLLLVPLVMRRLEPHDATFVNTIALAKTVLPIKFHTHLLNQIPTTSSKRFFVQDVISSFLSKALESGFDHVDTEVHIDREDGRILNELMDMGLTREGIPTSLGGSWQFQNFSNWCTDRATWELQQAQGRRRDESWLDDVIRRASRGSLGGVLPGHVDIAPPGSAAFDDTHSARESSSRQHFIYPHLTPTTRAGETAAGAPPVSGADIIQQLPLPPGLIGNQWTASHEQFHESHEAKVGIIVPQPNDILMGKGLLGWSGNKRFQEEIGRHAMSYRASRTRANRMKIVSTIEATVRSWGGRFLEPSSEHDGAVPQNEHGNLLSTEDTWTYATIPKIRKKIGQVSPPGDSCVFCGLPSCVLLAASHPPLDWHSQNANRLFDIECRVWLTRRLPEKSRTRVFWKCWPDNSLSS